MGFLGLRVLRILDVDGFVGFRFLRVQGASSPSEDFAISAVQSDQALMRGFLRTEPWEVCLLPILLMRTPVYCPGFSTTGSELLGIQGLEV